MSGAPAAVWHEVRTLVARARGPVERFHRCVHPLRGADARSLRVVARCGADVEGEGAGELTLNRAALARDRGVRARVLRAAPGGATVEEEAVFFEGLTPGWRSPSSTSEAGERARAARERPEEPAPAVAYRPVWHEAHPGRPDVAAFRICHHPVVKVTARYVHVQQTCPPWTRTAPPYGPVRVAREELARGEGACAWVADRDARGNAYSTRAWFFEGEVPAQPVRPPAWHAFREATERVWRRCEQEAAARASAPGGAPFGGWGAFVGAPLAPPPVSHGDLDALGLDAMPADLDSLKRAWREAARRTHPDAGGDAGAFMSARAAYERLAAALQPPAAERARV